MIPIIDMFFEILSIFFPSNCIYCKNPISYKDSGICSNCINKVEYVMEKCKICSGFIKDERCTLCLDRAFFIKFNVTVAEYTGIIKELLHNFKFNKFRRLYIPLCKIAEKTILENFQKIDFITYIPMNRKKEWERGYNQSKLLAKRISKIHNYPVLRLLKENNDSGTQKLLGYKERFLNVIDRFKVIRTKKIAGKRILLVDDVFTTGATLNECARILLEAGASTVFSLTIARVSIKRLENI